MHECKTGRNHEHSRQTLDPRRIHEQYSLLPESAPPKKSHSNLPVSHPLPKNNMLGHVAIRDHSSHHDPPKKRKKKNVVRFTACRYLHRRTLFYFWMRFRCDLDQTSSLPRVIVRFGSSFFLMSQPDGSKGVDGLWVDDVL